MYLLILTGGLSRSFTILVRDLAPGWLRHQIRFVLIVVGLEGLEGEPFNGLIFMRGACHSTDVLLSTCDYFGSGNVSHPALNVVIAATIV